MSVVHLLTGEEMPKPDPETHLLTAALDATRGRAPRVALDRPGGRRRRRPGGGAHAVGLHPPLRRVPGRVQERGCAGAQPPGRAGVEQPQGLPGGAGRGGGAGGTHATGPGGRRRGATRRRRPAGAGGQARGVQRLARGGAIRIGRPGSGGAPDRSGRRPRRAGAALRCIGGRPRGAVADLHRRRVLPCGGQAARRRRLPRAGDIRGPLPHARADGRRDAGGRARAGGLPGARPAVRARGSGRRRRRPAGHGAGADRARAVPGVSRRRAAIGWRERSPVRWRDRPVPVWGTFGRIY